MHFIDLSKNEHSVRLCTEKMINRHFGENGATNIYSNYNQMKASCECYSNQLKKIISNQQFH